MMKRIILIGLCFSLMLSSLSANASGSDYIYELPEKQAAIWEALGMYNGEDLNDVLTRAEYVRILSKASYVYDPSAFSSDTKFEDVPANNEYFTEINVLNKLGIVNGTDDTHFSPDEKVSFEAALITAVRMLGYKKNYTDMNEYNLALSKGLSRGVKTADGNITRYDALSIMYNALYTDVSDVYDISRSTTYLENNLAIFEVTGTVTDDSVISGQGKSRISDGYIAIDNNIYANGTSNRNIFGYKVKGFYKYDKQTQTQRIIYLYTLYAENITILHSYDNLSYNDHVYEYTIDASGDKTYKNNVSKDAVIVYNGKTLGINDYFDKFMMCPKTGTVLLYDVDDNGIYDIIRITSYVNYPVDSIDSDKKIIISLNNEPSLELDETKYTIKDASGKDVELSSIVKYNVISVAMSLDKEIAEILVSTASAADKITAKYDDSFETGKGGLYKSAPEFEPLFENMVLGKAYLMYLNVFNEIVYAKADTSTSEWLEGILIDYAKDTNTIDDSYMVKILCTNKEVHILKLRDKVKVYTPDNKTLALTAEEAYELYISSYSGLLRYKYNFEEELTEIEFALSANIDSSDSDRLFIVGQTSVDSGAINYYDSVKYIQTTYNFGGLCIGNTSTSVIFKPFNDEKETDDYVFTTVSNLSNNKGYLFTAYALTGGSKLAKWVIITDPRKGPTIYRSYTMAVSDIKRVYDANTYETKVALSGMVSAKDITFYLKNEAALSNVGDMASSGSKYVLSPGDIVTANTVGGVIYRIDMLYDSDSVKGESIGELIYGDRSNYPNVFSWGGSTSLTSSSGLLAEPVLYNSKFGMVGYVYSFNDGIITITNQDLSKAAEYTPNADGVISYSIPYTNSYCSYIDYSGKKGVSVRAGDSSDIKSYRNFGNKCSRVMLIASSGRSSGLFILDYKK